MYKIIATQGKRTNQSYASYIGHCASCKKADRTLGTFGFCHHTGKP